MTRTRDQQTMDHVLQQVLGFPEGHPLAKALDQSGYVDIDVVLNEPDDKIAELSYKDDEGNYHDLLPGHHAPLRMLRRFAQYRAYTGSPVMDWNTVTADVYHAYRVSDVYTSPPPSARPSPTPNPQSSTPVKELTVKDFNKQIKLDATLFPVLNDHKEWDNFLRSLTIEAQSQGVSNILNPNYKPSDDQDIELFKRQNQFMLAVFDKKLRTDKAKEAVRQHYSKPNAAQLIFRDVKAHAEEGTGAQIDSHRLLGYLTTVRWGSPTLRWTGTTEAFVRHWRDKVRQYENVSDQTPFGDPLKMVMLQNAVAEHPELSRVAAMDEQLRSRGKDPMGFEAYYALLISTAERYDKTTRSGHAGKVKKRMVYSHDITGTDTEGFIDTPIEDLLSYDDEQEPLQANKTTRVREPRQGRMPSTFPL